MMMNEGDLAGDKPRKVRLIVEINDSDGFTYSCTITRPAIYSSLEEFVITLEDMCKNAPMDIYGAREEFVLGGQTFQPDIFFEKGIYYGPNVSLLDEYFAEVEAATP